MAERVKLRAAKLDDLHQGRRIWVLGREAVVHSLDGPLVFYKYSPRENPKHRNFAALPTAFQVADDEAAQDGFHALPDQGVAFRALTDDDGDSADFVRTEEEEADVEVVDAAAAIAAAEYLDDSDEEGDDDDDDGGTHSGGPGRGGMHVMLRMMSKQHREEIAGVRGEAITQIVNPMTPVLVEDCHDATITIVNKVSHLTVSKCTNVRVVCRDPVPIAVNIIHCDRTSVQAQARTLQADMSRECEVRVVLASEGKEAQGDGSAAAAARSEGESDSAQYEPWAVRHAQCTALQVVVLRRQHATAAAAGEPAERAQALDGGPGREAEEEEEAEEAEEVEEGQEQGDDHPSDAGPGRRRARLVEVARTTVHSDAASAPEEDAHDDTPASAGSAHAPRLLMTRRDVSSGTFVTSRSTAYGEAVLAEGQGVSAERATL